MADLTRLFREKLKALISLAKEEGMQLSEDEVRSALKEAGLSENEEHFRLVCDYLDQMGIRVGSSSFEDQTEDWPDQPADEAEDQDPDISRSISLYLKELDMLKGLSEDEELLLFHGAVMKEPSSRERIIERYLSYVCSLAGDFEAAMREELASGPHAGKSRAPKKEPVLEAEDLLQEANMALVMAVDELEKEESLAAYRARLLNLVSSMLRERFRKEEEKREGDLRIISRLNQLYEASRELEQMEGRKPSAQELSSYLELPLEKIEDLIRIAGE